MAKDYYLILGVGPDASLDQIKSAYRRKAKRWHPDRTGEGSEPFLDIQEAYDVLGDAGRRRAYDEEMALDRKRMEHTARGVQPEPLRPRRCPVEPLIPTERSRGPRGAFFEPSFSSLFALFRRPWSDLAAPVRWGAGQGLDDIHLQVSLTREEALRGGRIRLLVPVQIVCPACRGRGVAGFFECLHCFGRGAVVDQRPVDVAFPGGVVDGAEGNVSLGQPGMGDLSLVLHFRVDEW